MKNLTKIYPIIIFFLLASSFSVYSKNKIVILVTHPRAISTAFERVIVERGDFEVVHEPFCESYYNSKDYKPADSGFRVEHPQTYDGVKEHIFELAQNKNVFIKDMAFHFIEKFVDDFEFMKHPDVQFVFLARNPAAAMASHYKMNSQLTDEEIGFEALYKMHSQLREYGHKPPFLISSDRFLNDPQSIYQGFCQYLDISCDMNSLSWEDSVDQGMPSLHWGSWHSSFKASKGIIQKNDITTSNELYKMIKDDDLARIKELYEKHQQFYNMLFSLHRI